MKQTEFTPPVKLIIVILTYVPGTHNKKDRVLCEIKSWIKMKMEICCMNHT